MFQETTSCHPQYFRDFLLSQDTIFRKIHNLESVNIFIPIILYFDEEYGRFSYHKTIYSALVVNNISFMIYFKY